MTIKTEQWEGASHAEDRQKAAPKKDIDMFEENRSVCLEEGEREGKGPPACEGAFQAMIRSLDFVLNSVCK